MPEKVLICWFKVTISRGDFQLRRNNRESLRMGIGRGEGSFPPPVSFLDDCLNRANFHTTSAFRAFFFVNRIGFSLFNCLRRTFLCARPTSYTLLRDDIGHSAHPLFFYFRFRNLPACRRYHLHNRQTNLSPYISRISFSFAERAESTFSINLSVEVWILSIH